MKNGNHSGFVMASDGNATSQMHEYDFVEQPSQDFFCPVSLGVLLEPYLTPCCGNHLSQDTFERLRGQPCPVCREGNLTAVKDKFHKRRVISLKVRCPNKAEGCEWEGELGSMQQHLNAKSSVGDCGYLDVTCPYACGERVQRRFLELHKSQNCPQRPFACQYCNHIGIHQEVTCEHWPVCEKYPLPCPNECGEKEIQRQHLRGHLDATCPLEIIYCEFHCAGCGVQLQRRLMSAHIKEETLAHLSMVAQMSKKDRDKIRLLQVQSREQACQIVQLGVLIKEQSFQIKQQAVLIKKQGDQIDEIKQERDQIKQQEDQIKQQIDEINIKQDRDQIKRHGAIISVMMGKLHLGVELLKVPPVDLVMDNFETNKKSDTVWLSPLFYSHIGGYKMHLQVYANGKGAAKGKFVSIYVFLNRGEFDDHLKWPFSGDFTIQLKKKDPPHYQQIIYLRSNNKLVPEACVCKPTNPMNSQGWGKFNYISHDDLCAGEYLKSNKLLFCISNIVVLSK